MITVWKVKLNRKTQLFESKQCLQVLFSECACDKQRISLKVKVSFVCLQINISKATTASVSETMADLKLLTTNSSTMKSSNISDVVNALTALAETNEKAVNVRFILYNAKIYHKIRYKFLSCACLIKCFVCVRVRMYVWFCADVHRVSVFADAVNETVDWFTHL